MDHAIHIGRLGDATKIVKPKPHAMPEAHPFIQDTETQEWRPCENTQEMLKGTQQHHQYWTATTKANKHFFFGEIVEDEVGPCGLKTINQDNAMLEADLEQYLPAHTKSTPEQKQQYINAHNGPLRHLFLHRKPSHEKQFWPCRVDKNTGLINDGGLCTSYRKAIIGVPGKARHEDFHLAVLGRMTAPWIENMEMLLLAAALLRYFPSQIKDHTRCPIPKDKPGETRPIAIGTDTFFFLSAIMGYWLMDVTEELQLYEQECIAYRKGRGCDDITHTLVSIREDAIENNRQIIIISEDEEKFFDRVGKEIQIAALRCAGFHEHGHVEIKTDDMTQRKYLIVTRQGKIWAKYDIGLPQGSFLSVVIANYITGDKIKAWKMSNDRGYYLSS